MSTSAPVRPSIGLAITLGLMLQGLVVNANVGRARRPLVAAAHARDVKRSLSDVMDAALGKNHTEAIYVRVERLKDAMLPTFTALPKNSHGLLGHSAVRYALHRHFVHEHAMYMKGLEPAGESWNSSSPTDILEDRVPTFVQHLFEERLHDGFDLQELALFAATLEHFINVEAIEKLKAACQLCGVQLDGAMTEDGLERVLDVYMALYLVGKDESGLSSGQVKEVMSQMAEIYPGWSETQNFVRNVQGEIVESQGLGTPITFSIAAQIVEAIGKRYGRYQDGECRSMAKDLIAKDEQGIGRIKLPDFYSAGWQFRESKEYLSQLGALDDCCSGNNDQQPHVIIPNYVMSVTNCLATSSIYSVCCIDQCEELLGHLERRIAAPDTTPEQIVVMVAALPSATVKAPRTLSVSLVRRLNEIAAENGGRVPLHGRLFAQWMHHAYPRECPFPHKSGTTKPQTADEWLNEKNSSHVVASKDLDELLGQLRDSEAKRVIEAPMDGDLEERLPWLAEEELVVHRPQVSTWHEFWVIMRSLALIMALFSLMFSLAGVSNLAQSKMFGKNLKARA